MASIKVDIGFLEKKDGWLLHPKYFPSKIGGKPAWLDLKNIPAPDQLFCYNCKDPMLFLCQVYAPFEESSDGFHRTVFIFVCRNGSCCKMNSSENFLVLRCQLPRQNEFYSYEPSPETESDFSMDKWPKLCELCGSKAPSHCSKCKKTYYCSRKHQVLDWQKGHKGICPQLQISETYKANNFIVTPAGKSTLFNEWELIVDEEDEEDPKNVDEYQEMKKFQQLMQEKKLGTLNNVSEDELEQYTNKTMPEDKVFNKFSKRIARHPDQVLRYDKGGLPLWITGNNENSVVNVPNCQYCNGERQFEFQIMPQLLNFIDVGVDVNSIDWGVLVVYTCKASCSKGPAYKQEIVIKQDLAS